MNKPTGVEQTSALAPAEGDSSVRGHTDIESVAYDTANKPLQGFSVRASYLKNSQQALIEISKDGSVVRSFEYPAYRIWNIPAHFDEYIADLLTDEQQAGGGQ